MDGCRAPVREPSIDSVAKALVGLAPLSLLAAFLVVGGIRTRTVIDDGAVTQHWILRSYRIPFGEITGVEQERSALYRWFLRVHCGERTFEVIPCQVFAAPGGPFSPGPPLAMLAVEAEIEARVGSA
jgi:hypothetical protein